MDFNEADTRAKLIDPAIHKRGWTEDLIRREETAGAVEIIGGKARRRSRGKIDYVLRTQAVGAFQNMFGADAAEVFRKSDGTNNAKNARIHIATYQTQAIEDGYLAACEIQKGRVNIDDTGITIDQIMARNPTDALTGAPVGREQVEAYYAKTKFEDRILLSDRVQAMCEDLFRFLLATI